MKGFAAVAVSLVTMGLLAGDAFATEAASDEGMEFGLGARIGGYGFRDQAGGGTGWNDCRMDGAGLFGTLDVTRHFFGEVSGDLYHATGTTVADEGMDRSSVHALGAVGARLLPGYFFTPYLQVGGGAEFTKVAMDGKSDRFTLPEGFFGLGGELNWKQLHFGATLRFATMGHPVHEYGVGQQDEGVAHQHLEGESGIAMTQRTASHALFSFRYTF